MSREHRLLLALLAEHRLRYLLGCFFLACSDIFQLVVPYLVGLAIDGLRAHSLDHDGLLRILAGIAAASLVVAGVRYGWRIFVFGTGSMVARDLRQRFYEHLQRLDATFYGGTKVGDLMAHATNDMQAVRGAAADGVMAGWDAFAMATLTIVTMVVTVDARLAIAALLPLALLPPVSYQIGQRVRVRYGHVQEAFSRLSDRVQENIAGIRVVKGFAREPDQIRRFDADNEAYRATFARLAAFDVAFDPLIHALAGSATAIGLGYGGWLVLHGEVTLGQYVAFNTYVAMMTWPMIALGWALNLVQRATASIGRLQRLLDTAPTIADAEDAVPLPTPQGALVVRGLTFRYAPEGPLVLDDVSLAVAPGQTLGVLGATGAGKSTLVALLTRTFQPPDGAITLDGVDVNRLRLADLRSAIACVPQDAFLFSRSIAANVAFDPRPHPPEAVAAAAALAQLGPDLARFPAGLDTEIGERGVTLSGGQRQRVGIARALLKAMAAPATAPGLVLDDCLSAVDAATEAALLGALAQARRGRATILVSHRTAALAACDEIVVMREGRIVERGPHAALVASQGEYARVHRLQQLEAVVEGDAGGMPGAPS